jgi:hypothetical protein
MTLENWYDRPTREILSEDVKLHSLGSSNQRRKEENLLRQ